MHLNSVISNIKQLANFLHSPTEHKRTWQCKLQQITLLRTRLLYIKNIIITKLNFR